MTARSRHAGRQRALALLYEADLRGGDPLVLLERADDAGWPGDEGSTDDIAAEEVGPDDADGTSSPFVVELVSGVVAHRAEIDALIGRYAQGWSIDRMPVVDRNVLRLGIRELLWSDVPVAVVIDEAVQLAKELSTADSGRFVNGVLAQLARSEDAVAAVRAGDTVADGA